MAATDSPTAELTGFEAAISRSQAKLESLSSSDSDRCIELHNLSKLWSSKYEATRETRDARHAAKFSHDALDALILDDEEHEAIVGTLMMYFVACHLDLYKEEGDPKTFDTALEMGEIALDAYDRQTLEWWTMLRNLSTALEEKANRSTTNGELDSAIEHMRNIVKTANCDPSRTSSFIAKLGSVLGLRYQRYGSVEDLDEAITLGYSASQLSMEDSDSALSYINLSALLFTSYQKNGSLETLKEALRISSLGLKHRPKGHGNRANMLCNRGTILHDLAKRSLQSDPAEALQLLQDAIECGEESLLDPLITRQQKAQVLDMIGAWLGTRLKLTKDMKDGYMGLRYLSEALKSMNPNHSDRPMILRNLAHIREVQYQILKGRGDTPGAIAELDQAIRHGEDAIESSSQHELNAGEHYKNLAVMLVRRDQEEEDPDVYKKAKKYLFLAAEAKAASPLVKIPAAIQGAIFRRDDGDYAGADLLLQGAVASLPMLNPRAMSSDDLYYALREVSGLASIATAMALDANRGSIEALQALESANCIVSSILMNARSDLSKLYDANHNLAKRYEETRKTLTKAIHGQTGQADDFQERRRQQEVLLDELQRIEAEVRTEDGFSQFQMSMTTVEDFTSLADKGPVIAINVALTRSDAFIVTSKGVELVPLHDLKYNELEERLKVFETVGNKARRNAVPRTRVQSSGTASGALRWLWDVCVKVVLGRIDLHSNKRVWWMTTGLAGRAPLHAAGDHSPGSKDNTLSQVISSYIPSFKALRYSRNRVGSVNTGDGMLLVTMGPNPRPYHSLNVKHEEEAIKEVFHDSVCHLSEPSPGAVLQKIRDHSFLHFACHGFSRANSPLQSGLLLVEDGQPAVLTLAALEKADIGQGSIAYLSACSTAEQVDLKLMDEAIHLSNSFQALGFQHVVGTLWGADDKAAGEVARKFYKRLTSSRKWIEEHSSVDLKVAEALHESIVEYKQTLTSSDSVHKWGPFIHIGV